MTARQTILDRLAELATAVDKKDRDEYLLLLKQLPPELENHPVKEYWAKYRANQAFELHYQWKAEPVVIHGMVEVAAHLKLSFNTVRQQLSRGKGSFTTRHGVRVVRV